MKVLLDENFPLPLLDALLAERIGAEHIVRLGLRGLPDTAIRARLDREPVLLLTNDQEFLSGPTPATGWVLVSRVRQSRSLDDRIATWCQAIREFTTSTPAARIYERLDDGRRTPSSVGSTGQES